MDTQRYLRSLVFISFSLSLSGCLFGENKQFFETPAGTSTLGITNGSPDPSVSLTVSSTSTSTSTLTDPLTGTSTSTSTSTGTNTNSGTSTGTDTSTGTVVVVIPTPAPTATPAPTGTPVATPTPILTGTPTPTATPAPSTTPVPTPTPILGGTPTPTPAPTATPAPSATPVPTATPVCTVSTTTKNLRIMFMIDNSGSTNTTDPNHYYRVKTIQDFLANYGSHTNLTYSFGYFSGTTSPEYDMVQNKFKSSTLNIFGNATGLSSALTKYESTSSSGNTPYSAAFAALNSEVTADEQAGTKQDYVIVFMSDGQPTDINGNVASGIISMVDQLRLSVQNNGSSLMTVSSVYFGPENDNISIGNLQTMANEGQGQFVDTNINGTLSIHDLITVPSCQ